VSKGGGEEGVDGEPESAVVKQISTSKQGEPARESGGEDGLLLSLQKPALAPKKHAAREPAGAVDRERERSKQRIRGGTLFNRYKTINQGSVWNRRKDPFI